MHVVNVSTCMCLWECYLCVWRSEVDFGYILYLTFILDRVFHWTWSRLFQLQGLVTESQPTCFHIFVFQHWFIGTLLHIQPFLSMLGILNYVCILYSKHFTYWSIVSAQKDWCLFLFFLLFSVGSRGNPEWVNFWVECVLLACIQPRQEIPWENGKAFPSGWGSENWQGFFLVSVQIIVCTENAHCNFLSWMITAQRLLPYNYCSYRD